MLKSKFPFFIILPFFFFFCPDLQISTTKSCCGGEGSHWNPTRHHRATMQGTVTLIYKMSQQLISPHALTWGEPPGEKPWLETGEVGDWLAEDPTLLRYCWREEAWYKRIHLNYSHWGCSVLRALVLCEPPRAAHYGASLNASAVLYGQLTEELLKY